MTPGAPQEAGPAPRQDANAGRGIPSLRPYQNDASDALCAAFLDNGNNRLLIKKPTGTGKTVWFASLLKDPRIAAWLGQFPKGERKMLVIAHREELLTQAQAKIQKANPGLIVSIEQGDLHANRYSDVVIASIQTLAAMKFRRLERLLAWHKFRLVVVDEAHHSAAPTYRTALVHLGFLPPADASETDEVEAIDFDDVVVMEAALKDWDQVAPKDRLLIGVTATPNRSDAIGLGCVFQTLAYTYDLKRAIDDGWLVPITPWVIETQSSLDAVRLTAGDFNQKQLAEAVNNQVRNQLAVAAWKEHADGKSTIAFTVDVAHAHALAEEFRAVGVPAEALSGETPKDERRDILRRFTAGTLEVITNCMVLTEGTDLPLTGCILHAKPTKSATLYEQMTGRGLRVHPDDPAGPDRLRYLERHAGIPGPHLKKPDCIVLDMVDVARRHSLQTAPVLYGLPPGCKTEGQSLQELAELLAQLAERHPGFDLDQAFKSGPLTLAQLNAQASKVDIWAIPSLGDFGVGLVLNWIKVTAEQYRVQYPWADGTEILSVMRDLLGHWDVVLTLRPSPAEPGAPWPASRQRTLATDIPTAIAAATLAETFVMQERRAVSKLKDPAAPWRARPASPKQKSLLTKLRVPHNPNKITMGQASDLIDLAMARKRR